MPLENMRHEPYSLPAGFQWDTLNLDDPIVVNILVFYCFRKQILHFVFIVTPKEILESFLFCMYLGSFTLPTKLNEYVS